MLKENLSQEQMSQDQMSQEQMSQDKTLPEKIRKINGIISNCHKIICHQRPYFLSCVTLLWMSCEQPRQVYGYISMGIGSSQLIYRRVAHD